MDTVGADHHVRLDAPPIPEGDRHALVILTNTGNKKTNSGKLATRVLPI
jgi:hypothetical protein